MTELAKSLSSFVCARQLPTVAVCVIKERHFRSSTGSTLQQESLQCNRAGVFSTEYFSCKKALPLPAKCCLMYTTALGANKLEWYIQISAFTTGKAYEQMFHHGIHNKVFKYIFTSSRQLEVKQQL